MTAKDVEKLEARITQLEFILKNMKDDLKNFCHNQRTKPTADGVEILASDLIRSINNK